MPEAGLPRARFTLPTCIVGAGPRACPGALYGQPQGVAPTKPCSSSQASLRAEVLEAEARPLQFIEKKNGAFLTARPGGLC